VKERKENEMAFKDADELNESRPYIDWSGPEGNAFVIMGRAQGFAEQLGLDSDAILKEMKAGNYEHLVETFEKYFGEYVDIYR
jgi:hypothetical protein